MVNIDTVYQRVLALANKEQRGYITPQEFNLLSSKAQLEIFDSYFHDIKTAYHKHKNQMGSGFDDIEMIQEKLQPFHISTTFIQDANNPWIDLTVEQDPNNVPISSNLYMIDTLEKLHLIPSGFSFADGNDEAAAASAVNLFDHLVEVTEMTNKEVVYSQQHPLTAATQDRPVYVRDAVNFNNSVSINQLRLYPTPSVATTFILKYWKTPLLPTWTYVVVGDKALYNVSAPDAQNFELHASEEERLVNRILQLSGVIIEDPNLQQSAMVDRQNTYQSQNN